MKKTITLLALCLSLSIAAQDTDCPTMIADAHEHAVLEKALLNSAVAKSDNNCNVIRVVVHVIYNGKQPNTSFNGWISEAQVLSQIRITNQFFRNDSLMYHEDNVPLGYTVELATTDPDGNPTTGIVYHDGYALWGERWATYGLKYNHPQAISEGVVANAIGWNTNYVAPYLDDRDRYLNVYVVSAIDGNTGGGIQAYAYFPTTSAVFGNYVLFNAFGAKQLDPLTGPPNFNLKSYTNKGHTWTHELMHNFAIFHTFQGNSCTETNCAVQGDRVCDTPPQTQPVSSYACGVISGNVMDYISQNYKHKITAGQVERANAVIQVNLQDYLACPPVAPAPVCDNKQGDFNADGVCNILDVAYFITGYNTVAGNPKYQSMFDFDCNGQIDAIDLSTLLTYFGNVYTQQSIISFAAIPGVLGKLYNVLGQEVDPKGYIPVGIYIFVAGETATKILITE